MAKTKNRARIITSGNAVALLSFTETYILRNIYPASTAALQKTMSRDIIKTGSTKSFGMRYFSAKPSFGEAL